MAPFYAHTFGDDESNWEHLDVHLQEVAELTAKFASTFAAEEWGRLAGLWHDVGKYQEKFQRRIRGERIQVPHAGIGAAFAWSLNPGDALPLAFAIAGHHTGLSNWEDSQNGPTPLKPTISSNEVTLRGLSDEAIAAFLPQTLPLLRHRIVDLDPANGRRSIAFFTRMLFSALVDADRLATEGFYDRSEGREGRSSKLIHDTLDELSDRLDAYIDQMSAAGERPRSAVNVLRRRVLHACRESSSEATGLFSLTVPTGGEKRLLR